jgi:uncharacterized membrane protein
MDAFRQLLPKPWLYLAIVVFGIVIKFYNLNYKLFWRDEVSSVLYASGVKESLTVNQIPVNEIKSVKFYDSLLDNSQKPDPLKNQVQGIFSNTHLTPAHYVFLTIWYRLVGDDEIHYRFFSVFIFILSLPFMFLLAKNLAGSNLAGWIGLSLYSVSPLIHFLAQETRYYMVWVFFFILSNYLFLLAIKQNKILWWTSYIIASILALYTSLLSALFIIGHLIYILLYQKALRMKFTFCLLLTVLAYLPWLYFLFTEREAIITGMSWHVYDHASVFSLEYIFFQLLGWVRAFTYLVDWTPYFQLFSGTLIPGLLVGLLVDIIVLGFIFYAIWYLATKSPKETKRVLILIILPLFLFFYISDIIRNGLTSIVWNYHIVNMVGIILVVTILLTDKIRKGKLLFVGFYLGLIIMGISTTLKTAEKRCWNTTPDCPSVIEIARVISQSSKPLIITDFGGIDGYGFMNFLAILNESRSGNADIMYCKGAIPDMKVKIKGKEYSEVYVIQSSDELVQNLKSNLGEDMVLYRKLDDAVFSHKIWKIKR